MGICGVVGGTGVMWACRQGWAADYSRGESLPGSSSRCSNLAVNGAQGRARPGLAQTLSSLLAQGAQESMPALTCGSFLQLAFPSRAHMSWPLLPIPWSP